MDVYGFLINDMQKCSNIACCSSPDRIRAKKMILEECYFRIVYLSKLDKPDSSAGNKCLHQRAAELYDGHDSENKKLEGMLAIANELKKSSIITNSEAMHQLPYFNQTSKGMEILDANPVLGRVQQIILMDRDGWRYELLPFFVSVWPKMAALAAIAAYYKQKNDIDIKISTALDLVGMASDLLKNHEGDFQVGIIAGNRVSGKGIMQKHLVPLILARKNDQVEWVVFDSETKMVEPLKLPPGSNVLVIESGRQKDTQSCRNDAVLILKDALKYKNVVARIKEAAELSEGVKIRYNAWNTEFRKFPHFLGKTVQANRVIRAMTDNAPVVSIGRKPDKSLQKHLNLYTRTVNCVELNTMDDMKLNMKLNMYLHVKPYDLICKAYDLLKNEGGKLDQNNLEGVMREHIYGYKSDSFVDEDNFIHNEWFRSCIL